VQKVRLQTIPQIAVEIVKDFEGFREYLYPDVEGIPTIGYGHTDNMHEGDLPITCTEEQAEQWLKEDMFESAEAVLKMVNVPLTDNQFGALVCLCFNIGQGRLKRDSIIRLLNDYDYKGAAGDWWQNRRDKAPSKGGVILEGLQERRSAECHYFLTGEYHGRIGKAYKPGGKLFYGPID
jgi:lysozyme